MGLDVDREHAGGRVAVMIIKSNLPQAHAGAAALTSSHTVNVALTPSIKAMMPARPHPGAPLPPSTTVQLWR